MRRLSAIRERPSATLALNRTEEGDAELLIFDAIGGDLFSEGVSARDVVEQIGQLDPGASITVRINSPGGLVFDGIAIYNALSNHPGKVRVVVEGVAASIASVIAMAGSTRTMRPGSFMMIHRAHILAIGNADDLRESADVLDKMDGTIASIYAKATGRRPQTMLSLMTDETWMTAEEAVEGKFANEVAGGSAAKALGDLTIFDHTPEQLLTDQAPTKREAERALRDAGLSRSAAAAVLSRGWDAREPAGEPDPGTQGDPEPDWSGVLAAFSN